MNYNNLKQFKKISLSACSTEKYLSTNGRLTNGFGFAIFNLINPPRACCKAGAGLFVCKNE